MARRGSFGLQPRVAPNVTNMIVSLAREYVAKRQALIMDAWRNGGTFEGKKATDDMVLAFWRNEMKDLDPNDPNYEEAKNNVLQLQYAVEQSKHDLAHVQGKLSDEGYAQFFLKWSKKVPKNSEFYRTLQKDAAQLMEQAKERNRVNGERARTEAFNAFVQKTTDQNISIGTELTKAMQDLSQKTGLSITGNGDELLAMLTSAVRDHPDQYRGLTDAIHKADPNWNGELTEGYYTNAIKEATEGYDLIADRAQKAGYVSAYASAVQGMANMSTFGQNAQVWPAAQTYTTLMNSFNKVLHDPTASQMDITNAASQTAARLAELAQTPGMDPASKSMITADSQRLLGQDAGDDPSFGTAMLGREGVSPELGAQLGAWNETAAQMKANPTAWAYAPVDKAGNFDPTGSGPLGIVPAGAVPPGAQGVMVPGRDGKAVMAMVMPHAVYAKDPNDPNAAPQLVGHRLDYNIGGRPAQLWGYRDDRGGVHWTITSPLADGTTATKDDKGDIYVTSSVPSTTDPLAQAERLKAQFPNLAGQIDTVISQLKAQQAQGGILGGGTAQLNEFDPKTGTTTHTIEVGYQNGKFTITDKKNSIDEKGNITGTVTTPIAIPLAAQSMNNGVYSPTRLAAGDIPGVTYTSPIQASTKLASFTQTQDQVSAYASDPAYQAAFLSQTMNTLGTQNIADPRIAAAWRDVTSATRAGQVARTPQNAALRADLRYPGQDPTKNAYTGQLNINYGNGQTLNIPGLPSYMKQLNIDNPNASADSAQRAAQYTPLLAGLGIAIPPQMPQGSPAITSPAVTPTGTNTSTSGVTKTNMPPVVNPITPVSSPVYQSPKPTQVTKPGQAPKPF